MRKTKLKLKLFHIRFDKKITEIASNIAYINGYSLSELIRIIIRHIANDRSIVDRMDFDFKITDSFTTTINLEDETMDELFGENITLLIQSIIYNIATYNKVFDGLKVFNR